jgi:hypothetical protein
MGTATSGVSKKLATVPGKDAGRAPFHPDPNWRSKVDRRRKDIRRLIDRMDQIATQYGGADVLSPVQASLVERFAHIELLTLGVEARLRAGEGIDVGHYLAAIDRLHGIGKTLGLKRVPKDARTLAQLLAEPEPVPPEEQAT